MKIKKEIAILAVIILSLSVYLFLHKSDRTHYQLPEITAITASDLTRLEIGKSGKTIELTRKDGKWYIGPEQYLADTAKVNTMLEVISKPTLTALVSESGSFGRYDLDEGNRVSVKAWAGTTLSREMEIGKAAGTHQHTFIRLPGDNNVYHARGNFRNDFDQSVDALRDKIVLSFATADITQMVITGSDAETVFTRKETAADTNAAKADTGGKPEEPPAPGFVWETADSKPADADNIDALLSSLSRYSCQSYITGRSKQDFTSPLYSIALKGNEDYSLFIYDKTDKADTSYPAVSSQNDFPFMLSDYNVDDLKKTMDALLNRN